MRSRRGSLQLCLLGSAFGITALWPAQAQSYPAKPVRLIIPFPAGGPMDIVGRLLSSGLSETWGGVPMIADNRGGAGGNIGTAQCATAPPDGYTMCILAISQAVSPAIYARPGFDPVKDFAHVTLVATLPSLLVVHPALPVNNVKELIALAKAKSGALSYSSGGNGTSSHMLLELLKVDSGVNIVHVPYKGQAAALTDQISGRVDMMFTSIVTALPYVKAGRTRAIAVSTKVRFAQLPNVPTVDESGVRGFDGGSWAGVGMPVGASRDTVSKVHSDVTKILQSTAMKEKILAIGGIPVTDSPIEFTAFMKSEVDKWARVVKAAGIQAE
jgi:tripartite-type tricarboxylate transporter receptor subunit TctC